MMHASPFSASDTVREIARFAAQSPDVRRFRPNVVVGLKRSGPFQEDEWLDGVLSFGDGDDAPAITVTMPDVRCSMVNLDPDSASPAPEVLKAVVRANHNNAGITARSNGRVAVGQTILLRAASENRGTRAGITGGKGDYAYSRRRAECLRSMCTRCYVGHFWVLWVP